MKIDFSAKLLDLKGVPIKEGDIEITLGAVSATALLNRYDDEPRPQGDVIARRFSLAIKVVDGGEHEVTVEQAAELKALITKTYMPLVVGRVFQIIDGASA